MWPKYWSFSFSISLSIEHSGLISLGLTDLISLLSKGLSRAFCSTTIQKHQFFSTQPSLWSNSHIHIRLLEKKKKHSFDYTDPCQQSDIFSFNMLSRFVIAFLSKSKCPLISWLQSLSTVILELKKIKCQFPLFPLLFVVKLMGADAMILVF